MTIKETPFLYFPRFSFRPASFLPSFPAGSAQSLRVPGGGDTVQGAGAVLGFAFLLVVCSSFLLVYSCYTWYTHGLQSLRCVPALPWSLPGLLLSRRNGPMGIS